MTNLTEIKATLKYGRFVQGWRISLLYITIFITCMMPVITIIMLISSLYGVFTWEREMLFGIVFGNIFSITLGAICVYYLYRHKKVKNQVKNWLSDAILIKAKVSRMDILDSRYKPYQIKVEFSYNGKKYTHISEPGNFFTGYRKIFLRFINKDCKILYSPKFNQVMFKKTTNTTKMSHEQIFPWEEFLERYLINHEEFMFKYNGKEYWLAFSDDKNGDMVAELNICENGIGCEWYEYKSPKELLKNARIDGFTIKELWNKFV